MLTVFMGLSTLIVLYKAHWKTSSKVIAPGTALSSTSALHCVQGTPEDAEDTPTAKSKARSTRSASKGKATPISGGRGKGRGRGRGRGKGRGRKVGSLMSPFCGWASSTELRLHGSCLTGAPQRLPYLHV